MWLGEIFVWQIVNIFESAGGCNFVSYGSVLREGGVYRCCMIIALFRVLEASEMAECSQTSLISHSIVCIFHVYFQNLSYSVHI